MPACKRKYIWTSDSLQTASWQTLRQFSSSSECCRRHNHNQKQKNQKSVTSLSPSFLVITCEPIPTPSSKSDGTAAIFLVTAMIFRTTWWLQGYFPAPFPAVLWKIETKLHLDWSVKTTTTTTTTQGLITSKVFAFNMNPYFQLIVKDGAGLD